MTQAARLPMSPVLPSTRLAPRALALVRLLTRIWAVMGLAVLLTATAAPGALAGQPHVRALIAAKAGPPATAVTGWLRLEPRLTGRADPTWLHEGDTWVRPPAENGQGSDPSYELAPVGAQYPLPLARHFTYDYDTLAVLLDSCREDNPPAPTLGVTVSGPGREAHRYFFVSRRLLLDSTDVAVDGADFRPKQTAYLVRRELGLSLDDAWRVSKDADRTVIQRRLDIPIRERTAILAMMPAPGSDISKVEVNLRFSSGHGRPSHTALAPGIRVSPLGRGVWEIDVLDYLRKRVPDMDDPRLAEVIIFLPPGSDPLAGRVPLDRLALTSRSRYPVHLEHNAFGQTTARIRFADIPSDTGTLDLNGLTLSLAPSEPDGLFTARVLGAWLERGGERRAPLLTGTARLRPMAPPWGSPVPSVLLAATAFEPSSLVVGAGQAPRVTVSDDGRLSVNGTARSVDVDVVFQGGPALPEDRRVSCLLEAQGDTTRATALLDWPGLRHPLELRFGRMNELPPDLLPATATLHLDLEPGFHGLTVRPPGLYVMDQTPAWRALTPAPPAAPPRPIIPSTNAPGLSWRPGDDGYVTAVITDPARTRTLTLPVALPESVRPGSVLRFACKAPERLPHGQGLEAEFLAGGLSSGPVPVRLGAGSVSELVVPGLGPDGGVSPERLLIRPTAGDVEPGPPLVFGFGDFSLSGTALLPWPEALAGTAVARADADTMGLPALTPDQALAILDRGQWVDLGPLPAGADPGALTPLEHPWLEVRALVVDGAGPPREFTAATSGGPQAPSSMGPAARLALTALAALAAIWALLSRSGRAVARTALRPLVGADAWLLRRLGPWVALGWLLLGGCGLAAGMILDGSGTRDLPMTIGALGAFLAWRGIVLGLRSRLEGRGVLAGLYSSAWSHHLWGFVVFLTLTAASRILGLTLPADLAAGAAFVCLAVAVGVRLAARDDASSGQRGKATEPTG